MTTVSATFLLFFVMDPLGNIPSFLATLSSVDPARQNRIVVRELLIAYVALAGFLFLGQHFLSLLHISEPALTIAGGVVLFLIAVRMVFPSPERPLREDIQGEPFIVPLAIPYVAGPSSLVTVVLLMSREPRRWPEWLLAMTLAWIGTAAILVMGSRLRMYLGCNGMIAIERLMGMVLVAIAVQMFLNGVGVAFHLEPVLKASTSESLITVRSNLPVLGLFL